MNLKSLRRPDLYHGRMGRNYFEGWYFKLVDAKMKRPFAFIPGVFFSPDPVHSHAFIQVVDGAKKIYRYLRFPAEAFSAEKNAFSLTVDNNRFGRDGLAFNLNRDNTRLEGNVAFKRHVDWPDSFLNPGSMGFYNYIPKMQCYSQVCAMDFDLEGELYIEGDQIDFSGGRGYIEKNWGSAFPYSWVWVQCNHFEKERASLSCSLGHIPFLFTSFRGFLVGLFAGGKFYEFTTMNRSRAEVVQQGTDLSLHFYNARHSLNIECETKNEDFILLNGPRGSQMVPLVQENLRGIVTIELKETDSGKTLFTDTGCCAGVEYGGEQMMILD
jgi:tocopherol cyclase